MADAFQGPNHLERLIRHDRLVVGLALCLITILAWFYLLRMAGQIRTATGDAEIHDAMGMHMASWGFADTGALFLMWAVMMAGMMLPSAAPVILLVLATYRRRGGRQARISTAAFTGGYLAAWTGFSLVAALAQAALHAAALLSEAMSGRSALLAGGIFIAAGLYEWAPLKNACLSHCRSPLQVLATEWREGTAGAFRMGLRHGLFCVGCCWALMALLFAAGVMNVLWVAAIAALVLVEKLVPFGIQIGRAGGALLVLWGGYLIARSF